MSKCLKAIDLLEPVKAIFQRGSDGNVVTFGDEKYAECRLIEKGKVVLALGIAVALAACATPVTELSKGNDHVICGGGTAGSAWGGLVGYRIQEDHDKECVNSYKAKGYRIVE